MRNVLKAINCLRQSSFNFRQQNLYDVYMCLSFLIDSGYLEPMRGFLLTV